MSVWCLVSHRPALLVHDCHLTPILENNLIHEFFGLYIKSIKEIVALLLMLTIMQINLKRQPTQQTVNNVKNIINTNRFHIFLPLFIAKPQSDFVCKIVTVCKLGLLKEQLRLGFQN